MKKMGDSFKLYESYKECLKGLVNEGNYKERIRKMTGINFEFFKHLETKQAELYFNEHFDKFGEYIFHEDMGGSPLHDTSFDGLMVMKNTIEARISSIRFGGKIIKINWKRANPTAITREVSLEKYKAHKYQKEGICVIFIIRNNSDPHYYVGDVREKKKKKDGKTNL